VNLSEIDIHEDMAVAVDLRPAAGKRQREQPSDEDRAPSES